MKSDINASVYRYIFDTISNKIIELVYNESNKKYYIFLSGCLYDNILIKSNCNSTAVVNGFIQQKNEK